MIDQNKDRTKSGISQEDLAKLLQAAKDKGYPVTPAPRSKKRAQPEKEMSETDRLRRDEYWRKMREGTPTAVSAPAKADRKIPGREFDIDLHKFTQARLSIIRDAVSGNMKWPMYIYGEVGRGKTFLAAAIYKEWASNGPVLWMPYTQYCDRCDDLRLKRELCITDGFRNFEFSVETWWDYIRAADLVVIDDLGVGEKGPWRNEWIFELLERRHRKPLIFTSNLHFDNLQGPMNIAHSTIFEVFDGRVISRIREGRPIHLQGHDMRADEYLEVEA